MSVGTTAFAVPRQRLGSAARGRLPVTALGIFGGALAMVGAVLPWLTFFGGLVPVPGTAGVTGQVALALGLLSLVLGGAYALHGHPAIRWMLALSGAALVAVAGWAATNLLISLPGLQSDPITAAAPGHGIPALIGGAGLVFTTFFVTPANPRSRQASGIDLNPVLIRRSLGAALAFAGIVHLTMGPEHLATSSLIGGAMIAGGVAQLGLAVAVARVGPRGAIALAVIAVSGAFLFGWLLAVTAGLPVAAHPHDGVVTGTHGTVGHVEAVTPLGVITAASELLSVAFVWLTRRGADATASSTTIPPAEG